MKSSRFWTCDTFPVWLMIAVASLWFGVLALTPGQTMVQATYKEALKLMPQYGWGLAFLFVAMLAFACACFIKNHWFRIAVAVTSCTVWLMLVAAVAMHLHSVMPLAGEVAILAASMFVMIRAISDE